MRFTTVYNEDQAWGYNSITAISGFARVPRRLVKTFFETVGDAPRQGAVLDFGCGTGRLTQAFRDARPDLMITGIEPSAAMASLFRIKFRDDPSVSMVLGGCDAEFHPSLKDRYDIVASTGVFDHLKITPSLMTRFLSVVKPGGYAAFSYQRHSSTQPHKSSHEYNSHADGYVQSCLQEAGGTILHQSRMIGYIIPFVARYGLLIAQKTTPA